MIICPRCNSGNNRKNGKRYFRDEPYQSYLCKDCSYSFVPDKPSVKHVKSNERRLKHHHKTYRSVLLKPRFDTYGDLIERFEKYVKVHPGRLQSKIIEILNESFPDVEDGE